MLPERPLNLLVRRDRAAAAADEAISSTTNRSGSPAGRRSRLASFDGWRTLGPNGVAPAHPDRAHPAHATRRELQHICFTRLREAGVALESIQATTARSRTTNATTKSWHPRPPPLRCPVRHALHRQAPRSSAPPRAACKGHTGTSPTILRVHTHVGGPILAFPDRGSGFDLKGRRTGSGALACAVARRWSPTYSWETWEGMGSTPPEVDTRGRSCVRA